ncbi:hypothetical protein [Streptosporangium subroseum]|uniref:hypothetical protein n=1 Tax=Streptosporangium subroseum TaxID=106412 RepID=UPI0030862C02|nr:hypothetical protein OHB15_13985 [Streptosporangium subroseum]
MALRFIGIDDTSGGNNCPMVWKDDTDGSLVLQGWEVTNLSELAQLQERSSLPDTEKVIRLPARMIPYILEACSE